MLSEFKDKQSIAYNLMVNDIDNNCITHAYLIDENNCVDAFKMVLAFVKGIFSESSNFDNDSYLCKRIDEGNYPEVKIISADGMFIKKQQIIDLQQEFSRTAVEGKKRVYIIRECEKMRPEASNSMLKFLEEPDLDVVAILMTNNINSVLSTIISRCKIIKLNNIIDVDNFDIELEDIAFNFVYNLEFKKRDLILDIKDILFSKVSNKDRDKIIAIFDIMIDIYYDVMRLVMGNNNIKFAKWTDKFGEFVLSNSLEMVLRKISILMEAKDSIKYNVNINLLVDSVIIGIGGISDDSRY